MLGNREELQEYLLVAIEKIRKDKKVIKDIKIQLSTHDIMPGSVQEWINNPELLLNLDIRELYLFVQQLYMKTAMSVINPENYFTELEKKKADLYSAEIKRNDLDFPIVIPQVIQIKSGVYAASIDISIIDALLENQLLVYDYELQREPVYRKLSNGVVKREPKLITKNVEEIEEHLLNGTLEPTTLVFNAELGSSEDEEEFTYNASTMELTINQGTILAIVDGFHRSRGSQNALKKRSDIKHNFLVEFTNYTVREAQQYQAQLASATPLNTIRIQQMKADRLSDYIVNKLTTDSDLKGKISNTQIVNHTNGELVSYNVLADTIEQVFKVKNRYEANQIAKFLSEFFDVLIGSHLVEFVTNITEVNRDSLINDNNMFIGYIVIAKNFYDNDMDVNELVNVINSINFSRNNKLWSDLNILNEKGGLAKDHKKMRLSIKNYFENLKVKELI